MSVAPPVGHSLRAQAERHDAWQRQRVAGLLPALMDETGIDCWVVCCREYAEDPVLASLVPAQWLSARRRTVLVLARTAAGVVGHAVSRYPVGDFAGAWDGGAGPDGTASSGQAAALARVVDEVAPRRIGIDVSPTFAHAGGITVADHAWLLEALAGRRDDLVDAEPLALAWLQVRLPEEVAAAHEANALAHEVIAQAFSRTVITPGTTTCDDVAWWVRQRFADLSVAAWFQPTVDAQRRGRGDIGQQTPILPGDLLHCDVGLTTAGLCTDTQQLAYVLDRVPVAPQGLQDALAAGNLAQDLVVAQLRPGRTGNEVLAASRSAFAGAGLDALLYSHPVGRHGHGAGPSIGLWDMQDGVPGSGDAVVRTGTLWALELGVRVAIPEWDGQVVYVGVEQGIALTDDGVSYLDRRQTELHLL